MVVVPESIRHLPISQIRVDGNYRKHFSEEELQGLMQSMIACGQLQPVRVRERDDLFWLTDGERRWRAAMMAEWDTLAAIVESHELSAAGAKQRALVSNCQRSDLPALDIADGLRDLMQTSGWNASEVATNLGFSNAKVSRMLALLNLPEPIRDAIREGTIPASCGADLLRFDDAETQSALAAQIISGNLTRDGLAGVAKRKRSPHQEKPAASPARITAALGNGRSITLAGGGLDSLDVLISWTEELLFKARKLRPRGLELSTFVRILRDESKAT